MILHTRKQSYEHIHINMAREKLIMTDVKQTVEEKNDVSYNLLGSNLYQKKITHAVFKQEL